MLRTLIPALVLALLWGPVALAQQSVTFGYLALADDPRYDQDDLDARYPLRPWGRPLAGAETALGESRFIGSAVGVEFAIEARQVDDPEDLLPALESLVEAGSQYLLLDLPGEQVSALAQATRGRDLLLFNLTARDDELRQEQCQAHLLHVIPNWSMLTDALAQYLVSKKWREVLLLAGTRQEDGKLTAALERSIQRFGLDLDAKRDFILSNDPRERERNNIALLTADADYDVVLVADTHGEFARNVPYHTNRPRPVAGAAGLVPSTWHWAWERHGAPQLNNRFIRQADRLMGDQDWAAWMAVKGVVEALARTNGGDFPQVRDYLLGEDIILDGFKGHRLNFRPWDRQLRQPVLLTTGNWVVERAPIQGFLHQTNNLDTLGFDQRDSRCEF